MRVVHHGNLGESEDGKKLYASVPMQLARDTRLTANAARVALYVWSHSEGYKQSAGLVAKALGMNRKTVYAALVNLQECGWLVREQEWRPGNKTHSTEVWHVQLSNTHWTPEEVQNLSKKRTRSDGEPVQKTDTLESNLSEKRTPTCPKNGHISSTTSSALDSSALSSSGIKNVQTTDTSNGQWSGAPGGADPWASVGDVVEPVEGVSTLARSDVVSLEQSSALLSSANLILPSEHEAACTALMDAYDGPVCEPDEPEEFPDTWESEFEDEYWQAVMEQEEQHI